MNDRSDESRETLQPSILIVDDDADFREAMSELARIEGFSVEAVASLASARQCLTARSPDLVLVDLALPDGDGLGVLADVDSAALTEVVVITGHASVGSAVSALKKGAADYLTKPVDLDRLRAILAGSVRRREMQEEIVGLRTELRRLGRFGPLIGTSEQMQGIYDLIAKVAPTDSVVFVQGESGTGKELVARTVHQLSRRRRKPFVALNCGAMSPQLIESELFGHERGSFTGADRKHRGYFERASGGTLLLDEVTEMPVEVQVKLLRALETGTITRVGAEQETTADVRFIAATNRVPEEAVAESKLRQDLLYRLNVFPIVLPPLRERKGDIEMLAEYFLAELNATAGTSKGFTRAALERLRTYHWPGNVRELKNVVERAHILAEDDIVAACLTLPSQPQPAGPGGGGSSSWLRIRVGQSIAEVERELILATLDVHDNKEAAARILGISLKTLYNRLNQYKGS